MSFVIIDEALHALAVEGQLPLQILIALRRDALLYRTNGIFELHHESVIDIGRFGWLDVKEDAEHATSRLGFARHQSFDLAFSNHRSTSLIEKN
jgi:hypothetical protein